MKELFELTAKKVAKIEEEIARSRKETDAEIAILRKKAEKHREEAEAHRKQTEKHREEAEAHRKQTEKHREEAEKYRQEAEAYRKETNETLKRMSERSDDIAHELGFYTRKVANIAEDYFYKSLKNNPVVNGIKFDKVSVNERIQGYEYDIVLSNGTAIMLISVKTNLRPSHIYKLFHKELPRFRTSYSKHYILYGAVASLTGNEDMDVLKAAEEGGYFGTWSN